MATTRDQIALPAEPRSVTVARRFARSVLIGWGLDELIDDAQLGVAELVANAVRHTDRDLALVLRLEDELVVEVHDCDTTTSLRAGIPEVTSTTGRGLQLVEAISTDWGVNGHDHGKMVWFSLALPNSGVRDADLFQLGDHRAGVDGPAGAGRHEARGAGEAQARAAI